MLGRDLVKSIKREFRVVPLPRESCDITDTREVVEVFKHYMPWVVIHAASFTDVDGCQKNSKKAYAVNAQGTYAIAKAAKLTNAIVFYISSDYVFSGKKHSPYRETDKGYPISVYGKTKYKGEKYITRLLKKYVIIRTSWLFGEGRVNFIDNVLRWAQNKEGFKIVKDKYANPTYTLDLSKAILNLLEMMNSGTWEESFYGVYHIVNSGYCSWYEYAKFVLKAAKQRGVKIEPIAMSEMKFLATRPRFSALDNSKYVRLTKHPLRNWREAVKEYIECKYN